MDHLYKEIEELRSENASLREQVEDLNKCIQDHDDELGNWYQENRQLKKMLETLVHQAAQCGWYDMGEEISKMLDDASSLLTP
jgi:uncharacterized coiled-coil DUF342 family protein